MGTVLAYSVKLVGTGEEPFGMELREGVQSQKSQDEVVQLAMAMAAELSGPHQHNGSHVHELVLMVNGERTPKGCAIGVLTEEETARFQAKHGPALQARNAAWIAKTLG